MKTEEEYFAKRDSDVMSSFGDKELQTICEQISNRRIFKDKGTKIRVLDIGCGSGMSMIRMQNEFLHLENVTGVDISPLAIKIAKKRNLNCQVGDAEDLKDFKDDSFDVVYGQHILEHVDPVKALNEAIRLAKKSIFIFPVDEPKDSEEEKEDFKFENERQKSLFHSEPITEEKLLKILRKVPNERHKIEKNVITYIKGGQKYQNYMLILYRDKVKRKK